MVVVVGGIAIIVTSSMLQETLRVEPCVELELNLIESDLEPSLLICCAALGTGQGLNSEIKILCQSFIKRVNKFLIFSSFYYTLSK